MTTTNMIDEFTARVLRWVQAKQDPKAAAIQKLVPYGTDWAGSTEAGFWEEFSVEVHYQRADGTSGLIWREVVR